jgi:hypothetical protein
VSAHRPKIASRHFLAAGLTAGLACAVCVLWPAFGAPAAKRAPIPDLAAANLAWTKVADDFQAPASGPGPVTFEKAHPYIANNGRGVQATVRIADVGNPILKPWVVEQMKKANEEAGAGRNAFEAHASCWPGGVPGFLVMGRVNPMYFIQSPKEVLMINEGGPDIRHILMDVPHSANPKPSWYGESVGHYENGDTLVVDTIGFNDKSFIDNYRTPHTTQLHVVERFKLVEDGKTLQVSITVEDRGAFNMAWSAGQIYHRSHEDTMIEAICAENNSVVFDAAVAPIPEAENPDF